MARIVTGDLILLAQQGVFDVIVHGCNCHCEMSAGVARAVRDAFPEAYAADRQTLAGDRSKLGTISWARVERLASPLTVVNGYTQFDYSGAGVLVQYEAVRSVMRQVKERFEGQRIGYPKIGAGLARGDWNILSRIIDEELRGEDHTLVDFSAA